MSWLSLEIPNGLYILGWSVAGCVLLGLLAYLSVCLQRRRLQKQLFLVWANDAIRRVPEESKGQLLREIATRLTEGRYVDS